MKRVLATIGATLFGLTLLGLPVAAAETQPAEQVQYVAILNQADPDQALDARFEGVFPVEVFTNQYEGSPSQQWRFERRPNGAIALVNKQSDQCVTATGPDGGVLIMRPCRTTDIRQHFIREQGPENSVTFESVIFQDQFIDMGQPNDVAILVERDRSPSQAWQLLAAEPTD
ncbi:RICIN domain-containing protein [Amycolatopsis anabasis]|uniref:RICIN domain-containing protein n=1 Tax=Amycolatopsis anabasis TaxID=1840409 RepID=UPI00131AF504|nr:hypothetical protein [Amycolatopsis anabasis]